MLLLPVALARGSWQPEGAQRTSMGNPKGRFVVAPCLGRLILIDSDVQTESRMELAAIKIHEIPSQKRVVEESCFGKAGGAV